MTTIFCCPHQKETYLHRVTDKLSVGGKCSQWKILETKQHVDENWCFRFNGTLPDNLWDWKSTCIFEQVVRGKSWAVFGLEGAPLLASPLLIIHSLIVIAMIELQKLKICFAFADIFLGKVAKLQGSSIPHRRWVVSPASIWRKDTICLGSSHRMFEQSEISCKILRWYWWHFIWFDTIGDCFLRQAFWNSKTSLNFDCPPP